MQVEKDNKERSCAFGLKKILLQILKIEENHEFGTLNSIF